MRGIESLLGSHGLASLGARAKSRWEAKPSLPLLIIFLSKEDVVSQGSVEDPGLLGHIGEGSTDSNAALKECHLRRKTPHSAEPRHSPQLP